MPPRIVHVISNLGTGGAENMLLRLLEVEKAASRSEDHVVISFLSGGALAGKIRALGVSLHELGATRSLKAALLFSDLKRILRETRPDVIQAWMYHGNIAASACRMASRRKTPILWNIRQTVQKLSNNSLRTQAVIMAGTAFRSSPAGIVYNSEVSALQHERLGYPRSKRIIIENGFEVAVAPEREAARDLLSRDLGLDLNDGSLLIGRVARKALQKDDLTLFRAFQRIAGKNTLAQLILIGSGMRADDTELAALARGCGSAGRVHFLGERLDVGRLTPGFDVAVSSSAHSEGFSNVIAEAMAAGVPTVATDVGDAAKIVGDPDRIVAPGDPDALAVAVLRILAMSSTGRMKLGERDRQRIESRFEMRAIARRYRELWEQTAAGA